MSGGAGSAGGSGGMGQQPMGNAFAQPGGGIPSYAQPYMNNLGGGMGNASAQPYDPTGGAPRQSPNQSNFGQGMNTMFGGGSPFGMQQQQPYGMQQMQNPFQQMNSATQGQPVSQDFMRQQMGSFGQGGQQQGPIREDMSSMGQLGAPNQMPQPMGQPGAEGFPPAPGARQQPSYMNNPDFQAYQKQEQDLGRQMNEYMQKAPMFQQLQDLQGKLRGFQQPQQGQMQNPYGNIDQMQQQRNMQDQARQQRMYEQATQQDARRGMTMDMPQGGGFGPRMGGYGGGRGAFGGRMGGRGGYGRQMPQQDYGYGQMQNQMQQQAQFGQQQRQQYGGLDALQQYLQPPSYRPPVVAPQPLDPGLTMPKPPPPPPPSDDGGYTPAPF